jgi:hypothetical protein
LTQLAAPLDDLDEVEDDPLLDPQDEIEIP